MRFRVLKTMAALALAVALGGCYYGYPSYGYYGGGYYGAPAPYYGGGGVVAFGTGWGWHDHDWHGRWHGDRDWR